MTDKPRAYENVNVFARLEGDARALASVRDSDRVVLEPI